jgi:hypothetical protein
MGTFGLGMMLLKRDFPYTTAAGLEKVLREASACPRMTVSANVPERAGLKKVLAGEWQVSGNLFKIKAVAFLFIASTSKNHAPLPVRRTA